MSTENEIDIEEAVDSFILELNILIGGNIQNYESRFQRYQHEERSSLLIEPGRTIIPSNERIAISIRHNAIDMLLSLF